MYVFYLYFALHSIVFCFSTGGLGYLLLFCDMFSFATDSAMIVMRDKCY